MTRLALTPKTLPGSYPSLPLTANSVDFTFTPAGASFADGASYPLTGNEILLVHNGNVGAQTVTISSVVDDLNRTGDITTYSLAAGEYAAFGPFKEKGWRQSTGLIHIAASATDVEFAVLKLPASN
jgi:hypothetical protein